MLKGKKFSIYPLLVFLGATLWGCISLFARPLNEYGFSAVQNVMIRSFITALLVGIVLLIKDRKAFLIPLKLIPLLIVAGVVGFLGSNFCYMSSINANSVSVACMLMYTSPIYVIIFGSILFKESITPIKIISLIGTLGGTVVLLSESGFSITLVGLFFGIGSGIGFASYSIFAKYFAFKVKSETLIFYVFLFAFLGSLPFAQLGNFVKNIGENTISIWYLLGISVLSTFLPYLLYTTGIRNMQVGKANIIAIFELVVSSLVGAIFFSEKLGFVGILGIIIVIASLVLLEINPKLGTTEHTREKHKIKK